MSENGSPQTPTRVQAFHEAVNRQLLDLTPSRTYDAPEDTSKVSCLILMEERWFRELDQEEVEQRLQNQIQKPPYHKARATMLLGMIERYTPNISIFGLPDLFRVIDGLKRLLVDMGATPDDIENAHREISDMAKEFWDEHCAFHERRKEEVEQEEMQRFHARFPQSPRDPSALPLTQRFPNRLSLSSIASSKEASRRVLDSRVRKKGQEKHNSSEAKGQKTRRSGRLEASTQAREQETGAGASLDSASGRRPTTTTSREKTVPSAQPSRGRVGTKTKKPAEKPRRSAGGRKSTRIQEQKKPTIREYDLRSKRHRVVTR
ncbi:hypothetical protein AYO20_08419 [Fonsecaea nubica]|uniref:Uncharacterized protein n=1 Tax=Fonsecaea nubica TaxID=856822 RepID=A0A178CMP1_9EURO|nr:hypothetical protein AYO20_08419 [Fonsecaea nubica]OAL31088.1 hypothetical protein AYO20_08419 [Fonsecaea nubica]